MNPLVAAATAQLFPRSRSWWWLWPLPALVALYIACAGSGATWLVGFSWIATLWPVAAALERAFGPAAGRLAHGVSAVLVALQLALPTPRTVLQPVYLDRYFTAPEQYVQHSIRLPLGTPEWSALWARTAEPEAYVYVWVKKTEGLLDPGLAIRFEEETVGVLDASTALAGDPAESAQLWHRIRVSRAAVERRPELKIVVSPQEGRLGTAERIGVLGGFSHRPSAPPSPSAFFDGSKLTSEPSAMFSDPPPGVEGPLRYYIELRVVDAATRRVLATYY